jgi:adenylate kinase
MAEVAAYLAGQLGLPQITLRDAAQSAVRAGAKLGAALRRYLDTEQVLPPEFIAALVRHRLEEADAAEGFVYSATPPSLPVLRSLEPPDLRVVEMALTDAEATRRLTSRRSCRQCGKSFHVGSAPAAFGNVCNLCNGELFRRADDAPPVVAQRLNAYHEYSRPVLTYYRAQGRLVSVDASRPAPTVATELYETLDT